MFQLQPKPGQTSDQKNDSKPRIDNSPEFLSNAMQSYGADFPPSTTPMQMMVDGEEEGLQMKSSEKKPTQGNSENASSTGAKTAMPADIQSKMENSFGTDFSQVNIHQNDEGATQMGALAYTQGNNVHFAPGQYNPGSNKGQELLGHELTHVVQQREERVKPTKQGKGFSVNDNPSLENEADTMGKLAASGNSVDVVGAGNGVMKKDSEDSDVKKHPIVWGDTLSEIAQQYNVSVESLAEWNNIENVDLIYAGDEIYVEDPQKNVNRENFETYPQVNESSGWLMGEKGIQGTTANSMIDLVAASLRNFDVVNLTGGLLEKIQNDPDMIATQQEILDRIKANPRYKKEDFYITGSELVEFGGKRWSASDEEWGSLSGKNPALHGETWDVAKNELTWALRHATVKYWAEVNASGSITIQYRLNDRLDLSGSSGRSSAYNIISDVLGFGYHTIAGGNINLQTRAEWTVNF